MTDKKTSLSISARERLERLSRRDGGDYDLNPAYSRRIRKLRIFLPLIAAIAITVTFVWSSIDSEDIISAENQKIPQLARNELLNPSFESRDEKGQPYKITATHATQDPDNEKLVYLTKPFADIILNEGNRLALKADQGEYTQDQRQLLLHGNVQLSDDEGYELTTKQLHIDLMESRAQTDTAVQVQGPAGLLRAAGLRGSTKENHLVFTGPAKLILTGIGKEKGLKGLAPP